MITDQELGMDTTCGCHAFVGAKADKNATIVQRVCTPSRLSQASMLVIQDILMNTFVQLLDAGLIILGKANLTVSDVDLTI